MSQNTSSPLKTTWEAAFDAIRGSQNLESAVQFVLKSAVTDLPAGFYAVGEDSLLPTYKGQDYGQKFTIRELGPVCLVTQARSDPVHKLGSSQTPLFGTGDQQSGRVPTENSLNSSSAET